MHFKYATLAVARFDTLAVSPLLSPESVCNGFTVVPTPKGTPKKNEVNLSFEFDLKYLEIMFIGSKMDINEW